jgi:hypothetical protein
MRHIFVRYCRRSRKAMISDLVICSEQIVILDRVGLLSPASMVLDHREPAKTVIRMIACQRFVAGVVHEDKQTERVDSQRIGRIHRSLVPRGLSLEEIIGRLPVDLNAENILHIPAENRRVSDQTARNPLSPHRKQGFIKQSRLLADRHR